jgi:phosphoenolpyruvate carboxylase
LSTATKLESQFLASLLEKDGRAASIQLLAHKLRLDRQIFLDLLEKIDDASIPAPPDDSPLEIGLLHSIRIALIIQIYILAARLPNFAGRDDLSRSSIFSMILSLDIDQATHHLRKIFPHERAHTPLDHLDETVDYNPDLLNDYEKLDKDLIAPMHDIARCIRRVSMGISCYFGAFG